MDIISIKRCLSLRGLNDQDFNLNTSSHSAFKQNAYFKRLNFLSRITPMTSPRLKALSVAVGVQIILSGCSIQPFSFERHATSAISSTTDVEPKPISVRHFSPARRFMDQHFQKTESATKSAIESPALKQEKNQQKMANLDLEIELLQLENQRIQEKTAYLQRQKLQIEQQKHNQKKELQPVTSISTAYAELKKEVVHAQLNIQKQLQAIELAKSARPTPEYQAMDVAFKAEVNSNDDVIEDQTLDNQMYFTVYVTTEKFDWINLWGQLEQGGIEDKWKGFSTEKSVYFIYVGAYGQLSYAEKRKDDLAQRIGQAPDIVQSHKQEKMDKIALLVLKNRG